MRVRISDDFKAAFKRLKKKHKSLQNDFETLLHSLLENPRQGMEILPDVWKVRMRITSKGRGKSGGARVIVRIKIVEDELQLIYIYDKADYSNVSDTFLKDILRRMS